MEWWKWILEQPKSSNPCFTENPTADIQPFNSKNVWFLAGAFNSEYVDMPERASYRKIDIPAGKSILLPVLNAFGVERHTYNLFKIEGLDDRVRHEMNIINGPAMYVTVDGDIDHPIPDLEKYRVETKGVFPVTIPGKDNVTQLRHLFCKPIDCIAKGDGYWLFLHPFEESEIGKQHTIHSFGTCRSGAIRIEVNYKLNIIE